MSKTRWQVILHRKAERVLKRLAGDLLERIRRAIRGLASEPRPLVIKNLPVSKNYIVLVWGIGALFTRLKMNN
ncbi:MAG TPA: hypothetical protein VMN99_15520 [Anaerolineales bacterium]|nr:hypothetical protein [Anaerolineales bacterium]